MKQSLPLFLAGLILATVTFLTSSSARADLGKLQMDAPFDPDPAASGSKTRQILTYGVDPDGNKVPTKTLRITNNTDGTVYPIMRDPNSISLTSNAAIGLYDPYDAPNKEYRGYIGYGGTDGQYYFGLKPGESILVSVPLVFWNGARISVGTDSQYLAPTKKPNPLGYDPESVRAIAPAENSADTIKNGVVMWYRAEIAQSPNDDTEDQLAEWTIRDHIYLSNPAITKRTNNEMPDNQLVTLINLDVSNVDNLFLPLALEPLDAWVVPQSSGTGPTPNRSGWKPGSDPDSYGWTGAVNTIRFLQDNIREFTASPKNQLLGQYFEGKGWPYYNIPNPTNNPDMPIKIPSGANVFAQSPLRGVPSSYSDGTWETDKYMLSSGGSEPVMVAIGGSGSVTNPKGSTTLNLNPLEPKAKFDMLAKGDLVIGLPGKGVMNPIQKGTTVLSVDPENSTVALSHPLLGPSASCAFQFNRPIDDYASDAMIRLWYSWAEYYRDHWKDKNPQAPTTGKKIKGSMELRSATLRFTDGAHPELVEGMAVKGPGLDKAMTEVGIHQGDAIILQIASDKKSVVLSQVANSASTSGSFTFLPPPKLLWTPASPKDPGYPLIDNKFRFSNEPEWHDPYYFSQKVYMVMASMNQIGQPNNNNVSKFMQDIVGANMGYIFDNPGRNSDDGKMVMAVIRDMIKSVLRGVTDFTKFPDVVDSHGNHLQWYPNPAEPRGGLPFNVYNLDPFVWFVHVKLGFSGYGFSVDDDTADVGAGGASQMQLSVTGTGGLKNTNAWTIQAPFGPVGPISCSYSGPSGGDTLYNNLKSVSNTTPIMITTPGQHNLPNGATVVIDQVHGDAAANGTFKIGNVTKDTFELFDLTTGQPIAPKGTYTPTPTPGRWSYPLHPYIDTGADLTKVFYRVSGDDALGTFQGTFVYVDKTPTKPIGENGEKVRIWQLGTQSSGRLLLNTKLLNADGTPLPAGTYSFTFSGVANQH